MGPGKTITYKGRVIIHEDQATKDWFYPAMAKIISPYPAPTVAAALKPLLSNTPERDRQLHSFAKLDGLMALDHGTPSGRAADVVLQTAGYKASQPA